MNKGEQYHDIIVELLKQLKFHPTFLEERFLEITQQKSHIKGLKSDQSNLAELLAMGDQAAQVYSLMIVEFKMLRDYYEPRVAFIERLSAYIQQEKPQRVADYDCGNGLDLYCVSKMFKDTTFTGIERDRYTVELAERRNPDILFSERASGQTFDMIYVDFVYFTDALRWQEGKMGGLEIARTRDELAEVLRSGGMMLHHTDVRSPQFRQNYCRIFEEKFHKLGEEITANSSDGNFCYLISFGK